MRTRDLSSPPPSVNSIADFVAAQNAYNDRIDAAITAIAAEVGQMNDLITTLNNNPPFQGQLSADDQAALESLEAHGESIAEKLEALEAPPVAPVTALGVQLVLASGE